MPQGVMTRDKDLSAGLTVTWVGVIANVILVVLKLVVGITARSQALVADGVHSISDLFSDLVVYLGLKWGRKEADEDHPYGHGRIETVSGFIVGLILFLVGVGIAYNSIVAIYSHQTSAPSVMAIYVAGFSIVLKEAMYWYTVIVGRRIDSPVLIANAWHHRTDALSSVAVLIGVAAAYFNPDWHLADSIAALVVSYFIFRVAVTLMSNSVKELVDTMAGPEVMETIKRHATQVKGVRNVHDIMARKSGPNILVEMHVVVDETISVREGHDIADKVEQTVMDKMTKVNKVIVHIDPGTEDSRPR